MKKISKNIVGVYLLSVLIPLTVILLSFCMSGIYPFGGTSNLIWDSNLQYVDFFGYLRNALLGKNGISYSFVKGMGGSVVGLIAYYLSSPLNLLVVFFEDLQAFLVVLFVVKVSLSGLTSFIYFRKRFPKLHIGYALMFSTSYALMFYNIIQASNIMWLDGCMYLPLVALGAHYLIEYKRSLLLFLSTAVLIISNWYTGYMVCLFASLFFIYELLIKQEMKWKEKLFRVIQYGFAVGLGVMASMVLFLPTILDLKKGKASGIQLDAFQFKFRGSLIEILNSLGAGEGFKDSAPVFFCGSFVLLGIILYFINRKIHWKEKLASVFFLFFLVFTSNCVMFENVWNGMRKVGSYYCRFAFVIIFYMIYLAARNFEYKEENSNKKVIGAGAFTFCILFIAHKYSESEFQYMYITLAAILLLTLLEVVKTYWNSKKALSMVVSAGTLSILVIELFANAVIINDRMYSVDAEAYKAYYTDMVSQVEQLENYDDTEFYRVDQTSNRLSAVRSTSPIYSENMSYNYRSIAHYSSTFNGNVVQFMNQVGYAENGVITGHLEPQLLMDSLVGLKYIFSESGANGFEKIDNLATYNGKGTYYNPYALGLGYIVSKDAVNEIEDRDLFQYQNKLVSSLLGRKVECYKKLSAKKEVAGSNHGSWTIESPSAENYVYGYFNVNNTPGTAVSINGEKKGTYNPHLSYKIFNIGSGEKNAKMMVELETEREISKINGTFYYLDMNVFREVIQELSKRQFELDVMNDGYVKGSITAEKGERLLLTVPYENGWEITLNGQNVEAQEGASCFTVIKLKEGNNVIEMSYHVPGLKAGALASVCSVLLYFLLFENKKFAKYVVRNNNKHAKN